MFAETKYEKGWEGGEGGELWWGNLSDRRLVPVQCHLPACHLRLTGTVRGKVLHYSALQWLACKSL